MGTSFLRTSCVCTQLRALVDVVALAGSRGSCTVWKYDYDENNEFWEREGSGRDMGGVGGRENVGVGRRQCGVLWV